MPDRFTLLALSFTVILHNVCSWHVSEPLNHTMNDDGSVNVTCMVLGNEIGMKTGMEAKLKMNNNDNVCEIYNIKKEHHKCKWERNGNEFTFTLMYPKDLHKNEFYCEISKVDPLPIKTSSGPKIKLFRYCNSPLGPPKSNCSCSFKTQMKEPTSTVPSRKMTSNEDMYTLLIGGLIIVVVMISLYSIILTVLYIRLKVKKPEASDNPTYVPMQRNVKRHDPDNTEYVDMREMQKRGGSHRDMNHNSHLITL